MIKEIRPSIKADIYDLYPILQEKDREEVEAIGFEPRSAVYHSYRQGLYRRTGLIDDKVAAMWGVAGVPMGFVGQPYFLSSPLIRQLTPREIVEIYKYEVSIMLQIFPVLENYVDASYPEAIRLLKFAGFTINDPEPFGKHKKMFCKFSIKSGEYS